MKEQAIRLAKKRMAEIEQVVQVEPETDEAFGMDNANVEEEDSFLAGFGCMAIEEDDSFDIKTCESKQKRMANKREKKEKKSALARKRTKVVEQGKFHVYDNFLFLHISPY